MENSQISVLNVIDANSPNKYEHININSSSYNGQTFYDKQILTYIGFNTYCILRKKAPDLYINFPECCSKKLLPEIDYLKTRSVSQIEIDYLESSLTGIEIKYQIVRIIYNYERRVFNIQNCNKFVQSLVKRTPMKVHSKETTEDVMIYILISIVFVVLTLIILYILGFFNFLYVKNKCPEITCKAII